MLGKQPVDELGEQENHQHHTQNQRNDHTYLQTFNAIRHWLVQTHVDQEIGRAQARNNQTEPGKRSAEQPGKEAGLHLDCSDGLHPSHQEENAYRH